VSRILFISVIEVAIGEYGDDILDKLADSPTKNTFIVRHYRHSSISGIDKSLLIENGGQPAIREVTFNTNNI